MRHLIFLLALLMISPLSGFSQENMLGEKRERHRVWRKHNRKSQNYNPYLDRKSKDKPSSKMAREDKRYLKKQKKEARHQMRRSKRSIGKANRRRMKGN